MTMVATLNDRIDGTVGGKAMAAIVSIALAPMNALVQAWSLQKVWRWFLSPQYGDGPSRAAWYGIGALISLALLLRLDHLAHKDGWNRPSTLMWRSIGVSITCVLALSAFWLVGSVLGWVA